MGDAEASEPAHQLFLAPGQGVERPPLVRALLRVLVLLEEIVWKNIRFGWKNRHDGAFSLFWEPTQ